MELVRGLNVPRLPQIEQECKPKDLKLETKDNLDFFNAPLENKPCIIDQETEGPYSSYSCGNSLQKARETWSLFFLQSTEDISLDGQTPKR